LQTRVDVPLPVEPQLLGIDAPVVSEILFMQVLPGPI
jgi:hypothetical protein